MTPQAARVRTSAGRSPRPATGAEAWLALCVLAIASSRALAADEDATQLQNVVITARKHAEDLQAVPLSITALSSDELQQKSVQRLSDLGQLTPNLLYGQKVQSGSSAGQIYIRGIGQQDTNSAFSPGVGIYVDGVYLGRAQADDLDLAEIRRVEVLFGPQGTLFGKNTNGGAINIVTNGPDASATAPGVRTELRTGNYGRFDALGILDLPLATDVAALQLSATHERQDGYSVRADGQDAANRNRSSGRLQLLLRPADDVEAVLRLDGTTFHEHSAAYKLIAVRDTSSLPVAYAAQTPYRYDDRWLTTSDFTYDGTGPNENAGDVWGSSLTFTWDRPWGTLKSITAYRRLSVDSAFDPDGSPLTILDVFNTVRQHQFSQEFQATGTLLHARIDWVAGLYFFKETIQEDQPVNIGLELFDGSANFDPRIHVVNENTAPFGQANFRLTDRLTLTAGGRIGVDRAQVDRLQVGYPVPTVQQPPARRSASWSSFLPRLGLQAQWTPRLMTYASVSEGTKSGGFNGRASSIAEFTRFEPERVRAWEAGLRSDWLDRRLRFNATVFYSQYRDFQIQLNRSVTDPATGAPVAFTFVGNIPKARIRGAEMSLAAVPLPGLTVTAGLGLTDGRYESVLPGAPVTPRSQFVNAPRATATASAEYAMPLGTLGRLVGHVDYTHKSRIQYDYGNSSLVAQAPYGLLGARLAWERPDQRLSVYVFGTNLADTHYAVGGIDDSPGGALGEVVKMMGPPREWGLGVQARF